MKNKIIISLAILVMSEMVGAYDIPKISKSQTVIELESKLNGLPREINFVIETSDIQKVGSAMSLAYNAAKFGANVTIYAKAGFIDYLKKNKTKSGYGGNGISINEMVDAIFYSGGRILINESDLKNRKIKIFDLEYGVERYTESDYIKMLLSSKSSVLTF